MDGYLGIKVETPRAALAGFLASTPIPEERYADGEGGLLGPDGRGYWDPHRQPKLGTGQAQLPGARALNIGCDDSRPGIALVFVVGTRRDSAAVHQPRPRTRYGHGSATASANCDSDAINHL